MAPAQKGISKAEYVIILAFAALVVTALMFLPAPQSGSSTGGAATGANAVYKNPVNTPSTSSNNALTNGLKPPGPGDSTRPKQEGEKCGTEFTGKLVWNSTTRQYMAGKIEYGECDISKCLRCDIRPRNYWGYCKKICGKGEECINKVYFDCSVMIGDCTACGTDTPPTGAAVVQSENTLEVTEMGGICHAWLIWKPPEGSFDHYVFFLGPAGMEELPQIYVDGKPMITYDEKVMILIPPNTPFELQVAAETASGFCGPRSPRSDPICLEFRKTDLKYFDPNTQQGIQDVSIKPATDGSGNAVFEFTATEAGTYYVFYRENLNPDRGGGMSFTTIYKETIGANEVPKEITFMWPVKFDKACSGFFFPVFYPASKPMAH
jgi:hypothetical protein